MERPAIHDTPVSELNTTDPAPGVDNDDPDDLDEWGDEDDFDDEDEDDFEDDDLEDEDGPDEDDEDEDDGDDEVGD